jgi:hypothetical protein
VASLDPDLSDVPPTDEPAPDVRAAGGPVPGAHGHQHEHRQVTSTTRAGTVADLVRVVGLAGFVRVLATLAVTLDRVLLAPDSGRPARPALLEPGP